MQVPEGSSLAAAHGGEPAAKVAELRQLLEQQIALEDPFSGEIAVRSISKPFILADEALEVASWEL